MKYANHTSEPVRFKLRGKTYEAAPGGEVDVPDKLAFAVESRKLPLKAIGGPAKAPEAQEQHETLELWRERAVAERKRADNAEAHIRRITERLDEAQAEHRKALDAQSKTEQDLREQVRGYREQATQLQGQLDAVTKDRDDLLEAATRTEAEKKAPAKGGAKPS